MELLTIKEVCEVLKISRWTAAKIIESGALKASMVAGTYRVKRSDIDKMINSNVVKK